jgi:hypothetical protein
MKQTWFQIVLRVCGGVISLGCLYVMILFLYLHKSSNEDVYYFIYFGLFGTATAFYALRGNGKPMRSNPWYVWLFIAWPTLFAVFVILLRLLISKH